MILASDEVLQEAALKMFSAGPPVMTCAPVRYNQEQTR